MFTASDRQTIHAAERTGAFDVEPRQQLCARNARGGLPRARRQRHDRIGGWARCGAANAADHGDVQRQRLARRLLGILRHDHIDTPHLEVATAGDGQGTLFE